MRVTKYITFIFLLWFAEYLKGQKRYAHLFGKRGNPEVIRRLQAIADRNVDKFGLVEGDDTERIPTPIEADERAHLV